MTIHPPSLYTGYVSASVPFAFAIAEERKAVHCATKSNIMKLTEGLLQHTFEEFAPQYPSIVAKHILIDNCAHQLAMRPEQFDVIVTTNMNGDILSDLTSGLTGGLGFAPSANIGNDVSIFEAVHGSAPDIAGKGIASGMPLGAMVAREDLMTWEIGAHGSTYGGNPVACAAALATIDLLEGGLVANAAVRGREIEGEGGYVPREFLWKGERYGVPPVDFTT